jgi:ribose transport system ATP-binding protein
MEQNILFELKSITKTYGATTALKDVSVVVRPGEIIGLIGANGAGKSTLTRVISGVTVPNAGELFREGVPVHFGGYTPAVASRMGVRVVYQELSLCTNLTVLENFYVEQHATMRGTRWWRKDLLGKTQAALDKVFPDHGIDPRMPLGDLPITQRQMVEIARALSLDGLRLLILDEPTSSLGAAQTQQLMDSLGTLTGRGASVLFISHRLREIVDIADRVVVMRNGHITWEGENEKVDEASLVEKMTGEAPATAERRPPAGGAPSTLDRNHAVFLRTRQLKCDGLGGLNVDLHGGELVGVAGLDGSGQREFLKALFFSKGRTGGQVEKAGRLAYVTGDRKKEGVFPLWPVSDNMSIVELNKSPLFQWLNVRGLAEKVERWFANLSVKAPDARTPILSLSGGNQQKVLVARALLAEADVIFLDDPTKGVDVGTKKQMYGLFREAAENGKLVLWYSTEDEELEYCSRVLVFRYGKIVTELAGKEISKGRIIESSFGGEDLLVRSVTAAQKRRPYQNSILVPLLAMLGVFVLSGVLQNGVFTRFGVDLLLAGSIPLICAALSQMFIIGLSQVDLGVGAFMGLSSVLCATVLRQHPALGAILLVGSVLVYGAMGALIYLRNIPAVIVTMGMSFVWTGIGYTLQESPGGQAPDWLVSMFNLKLPIPESVLVVGLLGLAAFLIYRSKYGTILKGFGNNPAAVQRSGWSPLKAIIVGYVVAGIFAIIGGMTITAASGASDINSTRSYTLLTVAAVVMGGSELLGGIVSPWGTIIGAITLSLVGALIGFLRLNSSYVTAVQGLILIGILASRLLRKVKQ